MFDQSYLQSILRYSPETGIFNWIGKHSKKIMPGQVAGCLSKNGYIVIGIDGRIYYAHRLAWLYMTGVWPKQVDHDDNVKHHNWWSNLRLATHQQNVLNAKRAKNNTSGRKGVSWHKGAGRWSAYIILDGKKRHLGLFDDLDEAHQSYLTAAHAAQPEFVRSE